jgi:periplasmic copper chaperone A
MTNFRRAAVAAVLGLVGSVATAAPAALVVDSPWVRAAPPGAMMLAGYALLRNDGDAPVTLVGARSEAFGMTEIHRTVEIDGVARMREATPLTIAPGETLSMAPGGLHVMLMRPRAPLSEGQNLSIVLLLDDGSELAVDFPVQKQAP